MTSERYKLHLGDCLEVLKALPDASVSFIFTDPPYPCIDREYGYWTEAEWFDMMRPVVLETRRVLKPEGSAVLVLQPNSERVGRMRTWLWEFMAWAGKEWGIVQDAYWWNVEALPLTRNNPHTLRPSLKACVWLGPHDCYRNADEILWAESDGNRAMRLSERCNNDLENRPSGATIRNVRARTACLQRGGVTPFNVFPMGNDSSKTGHNEGHGAATPMRLTDKWLRYCSRPDDTILDPFSGTATVGIAALNLGRRYIGIERSPRWHDVAERRMAEAAQATKLLAEVPA